MGVRCDGGVLTRSRVTRTYSPKISARLSAAFAGLEVPKVEITVALASGALASSLLEPKNSVNEYEPSAIPSAIAENSAVLVLGKAKSACSCPAKARVAAPAARRKVSWE